MKTIGILTGFMLLLIFSFTYCGTKITGDIANQIMEDTITAMQTSVEEDPRNIENQELMENLALEVLEKHGVSRISWNMYMQENPDMEQAYAEHVTAVMQDAYSRM